MAKETTPKTVLPEQVDDPLVFLNPDVCRAWLLEKLHPGGPACPACGHVQAKDRNRRRFQFLDCLKCETCGKGFTAFTGTVFAGVQMTPAEIVLMLLLFQCDRPSVEVAECLDTSESTVRRWRKRLMHLEPEP